MFRPNHCKKQRFLTDSKTAVRSVHLKNVTCRFKFGWSCLNNLFNVRKNNRTDLSFSASRSPVPPSTFCSLFLVRTTHHTHKTTTRPSNRTSAPSERVRETETCPNWVGFLSFCTQKTEMPLFFGGDRVSRRRGELVLSARRRNVSEPTFPRDARRLVFQRSF